MEYSAGSLRLRSHDEEWWALEVDYNDSVTEGIHIKTRGGLYDLRYIVERAIKDIEQ